MLVQSLEQEHELEVISHLKLELEALQQRQQGLDKSLWASNLHARSIAEVPQRDTSKPVFICVCRRGRDEKACCRHSLRDC